MQIAARLCRLLIKKSFIFHIHLTVIIFYFEGTLALGLGPSVLGHSVSVPRIKRSNAKSQIPEPRRKTQGQRLFK